MELKDVVAVSGKSGLYEMVKPRPDGLIIRQIGAESKSFASSRKHNFTPLDNIGIYLNSGDTIELSKVFSKMNEESKNCPGANAGPDDLRAFFDIVIPRYDEDKFKLSDMKKLIQWFEVLQSNQLLNELLGDEEE